MLHNVRHTMRKKRLLWTLVIISTCLLLSVGVYFIPPVHDRLAWRLDALRVEIKQFFNPPEEVVFLPTQGQPLGTLAPQNTRTPTATLLPDLPTQVPTVTPTPLPTFVQLTGFDYVNQCNRWNYCGAANLTMALSYWGWTGNRDDVATAIKPGENDPNKDFIQRSHSDFNIMPYEMVDFVNDTTDLRALYAYGGTTAMLRRMIAAGFPVVIEKGMYERDSAGHVTWMGHYSFVTGYDDAKDTFFWQDSYPDACDDRENYTAVERKGRDKLITEAELLSGWRSFDYVFIVVYPPEREAEMLNALGPWADWDWAAQNALDMAYADASTLTGIDLFFSWFNIGTSQVALQQYPDAGASFDQAFSLYATLDNDDTQRPYRIMWYQTGPYKAYFYSGRYQDVIDLAETTLHYTASSPTLEESLYWEAMAQYALGDYDGAYTNMRLAVYYNETFALAQERLVEWGIAP